MGPCSVTKPNPENCKNCSSKCAYNCAQLQYTIQQNSSDNVPSYLQTNIIARMLSVGVMLRSEVRAKAEAKIVALSSVWLQGTAMMMMMMMILMLLLLGVICYEVSGY